MFTYFRFNKMLLLIAIIGLSSNIFATSLPDPSQPVLPTKPAPSAPAIPIDPPSNSSIIPPSDSQVPADLTTSPLPQETTGSFMEHGATQLPRLQEVEGEELVMPQNVRSVAEDIKPKSATPAVPLPTTPIEQPKTSPTSTPPASISISIPAAPPITQLPPIAPPAITPPPAVSPATPPQNVMPMPEVVRPIVPEHKSEQRHHERMGVKKIEHHPKKNLVEHKPHATIIPPLLELTDDQIIFIKNEATMLILPDDDVTLGLVTDDFKFKNMNYHDHIQLFIAQVEKDRTAPQEAEVKSFLQHYFNEDNTTNISIGKHELFRLASDAIKKNNLNDLRTIEANYPILNRQTKNGNSLLHLAVGNNNLEISKWLIMKGIKLNMVNNNNFTALGLSFAEQNLATLELLEQAGAR